MKRPPGPESAKSNGITGTRTNAETKRKTAGRIVAAMTASGMTPHGWQVRSLMASLAANNEEPTDEELMRTLMRAPWFPKPNRRHWRVGEGGGWAVRS